MGISTISVRRSGSRITVTDFMVDAISVSLALGHGGRCRWAGCRVEELALGAGFHSLHGGYSSGPVEPEDVGLARKADWQAAGLGMRSSEPACVDVAIRVVLSCCALVQLA
jgi:hypothetical protein